MDTVNGRVGAAVAEERKVVTVLFADVAGSTALGDQLDPERLRAVLQDWFSTAAAAIEAWGGTVEKFIGDAVVAVFGAPRVREDDASRALHAALELIDRLPELNRRFSERHGVQLAIRIGVNSGEVIAPLDARAGGSIVTGDVVNVAARLEAAGEPDTILAGERTYLAARGAFRFGEPIALELKGKAAKVPAYRVLGAGPAAQRGVPGLRAAMIGRERELDALLGQLRDTVDAREPRLVVVYGPAGIGKSRLLLEMTRAASAGRAGVPELLVLRGRCPAAGPGITYWPLAEILRSACGILLDASAEHAGERLRARVPELLAPLGLAPAEIDRTVYALATTAGIALPDNPLNRLAPKAVADELAHAWPRLASALATRPTALLIEDLHWASDEVLAMVERILARATGPLFLLATARPEFAQGHPGFAAGREDATTINLRPLTETQARQLVDELLAVADLPAESTRTILERSEGNPFFLEEILRRLIDEGVLVRSGDRWRATEAIASASLPDTVLGLLAARVDALSPREKRVLQEAAVVGRVFWEEPLRRALGDREVGATLLALEGRGLVAARPTSSIGGQIEYIFKHALVRDVAYASLPRSRRARSYAGVADWLEETAGDRREEFLDLLAHYYAAAAAGEDADLAWADEPERREQVRGRAFRTLVDAGLSARHRYALKLAVERHQRAVELAATDGERAEALEALGEDEELGFHGDEAWDVFRAAADVARRRGDRAALARIALKAARVATRMGTFRTTPDTVGVEAFIDEGLEAVDDDATRARLLIEKGAHMRDMWEVSGVDDPLSLEARLAAVREAVAIADRLKIPDLELDAEEGLGALQWANEDFPGAVASVRRQVELAEQVEAPAARALTYYQASLTVRDIEGAYEEGLALAMRSYELARSLSPHELMHATSQWMMAAFWLGRWDEIPALLAEHVVALADEHDRVCSSVRVGPAIGALMLAARGDLAEARRLAAMVERAAFGADSPNGVAALALVEIGEAGEALQRTEGQNMSHRRAGFAFNGLARIAALAAAGRWDDLEAELPRARELATRFWLLGPAADRAEARLLLALDRRADAAGLARRALAELERIGLPFEIARTRELLAELTDDGDRDELLAQALATYEGLGARPHLERVRGVLATPR